MVVSENIAILLEKRNKVELKIDELKDEFNNITYEICRIEGACFHCKNWHYPHCKSADEIPSFLLRDQAE